MVMGVAHFKFKNGKLFRGAGLLADDFRLIDADAKGGHMMVFLKAKAEEIIDRLARAFGGAIHESEIEGAFGRHFLRGHGFQKIHAGGDVRERKSGWVHFPAEGHHTGGGFSVSGGWRCFTQSDDTFAVSELDEDDLTEVRTLAPGNGPTVGQAEADNPELQLHLVIKR